MNKKRLNHLSYVFLLLVIIQGLLWIIYSIYSIVNYNPYGTSAPWYTEMLVSGFMILFPFSITLGLFFYFRARYLKTR